MSDPFAETRPPWWTRITRRKRTDEAPKRYAMLAGGVGSLATFLLAEVHLDHLTKFLVCSAIAAVPPALLEMWWKSRRRRASEQILTLPVERATPRA
ncbi:MAG TPA: hypothetical protein VK272_10025 [Solirubrobacteraceae bacterium]|nr:hypothetical protein [Solirubrobacteraceae bacterium]